MRAIVLCLLILASCSGGGQAGGQCRRAPGVGTGAPGACGAGRAVLACEDPSGGCECVSDDDHCPGCDIPCQDKCAANEYAVSCGGIPVPDASVVQAEPPAGCRTIFAIPAGIVFFCCPCQ